MSINSPPTNLRIHSQLCALVLYVIILSAALDLVPASTPKGLILLFDIFPSLIAKSFWPYLSKGQVRYGQRIFWNLAFSVGGVVVSGHYKACALLLIPWLFEDCCCFPECGCSIVRDRTNVLGFGYVDASNDIFHIYSHIISAGLGELTFLQLSTTYNPPSIGGKSVGYVTAPFHPILQFHVNIISL